MESSSENNYFHVSIIADTKADTPVSVNSFIRIIAKTGISI